MTIQELKEKYKEDKDLIKFIDNQEAMINNNNYLQDNLKLKEENEKLKQNNELLYSKIMNGAKQKEDDTTPRFQDYSKEIVEAFKK